MAEKSFQHRRYLKNFLLQPLVQVRLGFYSIVLAFAFSALILGILYVNLFRFYDVVMELTDLREEVTTLLESYLVETVWWVVGCIVLYLIINIAVSVFYTHRLVGPTFAFRRQIAQLMKANYKARITLRKGDAFSEVAEDLNKLAEALDSRKP